MFFFVFLILIHNAISVHKKNINFSIILKESGAHSFPPSKGLFQNKKKCLPLAVLDNVLRVLVSLRFSCYDSVYSDLNHRAISCPLLVLIASLNQIEMARQNPTTLFTRGIQSPSLRSYCQHLKPHGCAKTHMTVPQFCSRDICSIMGKTYSYYIQKLFLSSHYLLLSYVSALCPYADIDECNETENPQEDICGMGGSCKNINGSYWCQCLEGFTNYGNKRTPCSGWCGLTLFLSTTITYYILNVHFMAFISSNSSY